MVHLGKRWLQVVRLKQAMSRYSISGLLSSDEVDTGGGGGNEISPTSTSAPIESSNQLPNFSQPDFNYFLNLVSPFCSSRHAEEHGDRCSVINSNSSSLSNVTENVGNSLSSSSPVHFCPQLVPQEVQQPETSPASPEKQGKV